MSSATKVPNIAVSNKRKKKKYSLMRSVTPKEAITDRRVSRVVSTTMAKDRPSMPMKKWMLNAEIQVAFSTNWNSKVVVLKLAQSHREAIKAPPLEAAAITRKSCVF